MDTSFRRACTLLVAALLFASILPARAQHSPNVDAMTEDQLRAYAAGIHARVLTLDTHDDIEFDFATPAADPGVRGDRQVDLPKMRDGGLDVGTFIVYVGQTARTPENYVQAKKDAMTKFDAIHRMAEQMYPDQIEIAYTAADVERIHQSGKLVAMLAIENGYVIGKDLSLIQKYHDLGARYVTLAHNGHNDIADSAQPQKDFGDVAEEHAGLSAFGEEVVRELNRIGIMVDVSHVSKKAALHAARISRAPIIASHSSVKALCDVPRNMDDETMRALAATGGVMNIVAVDSFIKPDDPQKTKAVDALRAEYGLTGFESFRALTDVQRTEYRQKMAAIEKQYPGPTVKDFVDHIDYAVKLIGIEHVGISSDFDGGGGFAGWRDASETPNVTLELVRRGYTEEQIGKLWSGNYLRALREVERMAGER
jgi:membrane dipeptidase